MRQISQENPSREGTASHQNSVEDAYNDLRKPKTGTSEVSAFRQDSVNILIPGARIRQSHSAEKSVTIEEPTGSKSPSRGKTKFTFTPKSRAAADREKAAKKASNSIRSPRDKKLVMGADATKSYKGFGTMKAKKKKHPENNLYKFDERYF